MGVIVGAHGKDSLASSHFVDRLRILATLVVFSFPASGASSAPSQGNQNAQDNPANSPPALTSTAPTNSAPIISAPISTTSPVSKTALEDARIAHLDDALDTLLAAAQSPSAALILEALIQSKFSQDEIVRAINELAQITEYPGAFSELVESAKVKFPGVTFNSTVEKYSGMEALGTISVSVVGEDLLNLAGSSDPFASKSSLSVRVFTPARLLEASGGSPTEVRWKTTVSAVSNGAENFEGRGITYAANGQFAIALNEIKEPALVRVEMLIISPGVDRKPQGFNVKRTILVDPNAAKNPEDPYALPQAVLLEDRRPPNETTRSMELGLQILGHAKNRQFVPKGQPAPVQANVTILGRLGTLQLLPVSFDYPITGSYVGPSATEKARSLDLAGKPAIVLTVASWCGEPCRARLQTLSQRVKELSKDFQVIVVSLGRDKRDFGETPKKMKPFKNLNWAVVSAADSEYLLKLGGSGVPTFFVIDSAGNIVNVSNILPETLELKAKALTPAP